MSKLNIFFISFLLFFSYQRLHYNIFLIIGILPALVYRLAQNRFGAGLAAFVGTATNTLLVLSFIFLFFHDVTKQTFGALLASIITGNSIAEVIIAVILTMAIVPALSKARGNS